MTGSYPVFVGLQVIGTDLNPGKVELDDGTNVTTLQAAPGTTDYTMFLPPQPGVSGDLLKLTTLFPNILEWAAQTPPGQTIETWYISRREPIGTNGGPMAIGSWVTVELNTLSKPAGVSTDVQLAVAPAGANQIRLQAGEYRYFSITPALSTSIVTVRLQDITNGVTLLEGKSGYSSNFANGNGQAQLYLSGVISLSSITVVELQVRRVTGAVNSVNFGFAPVSSTEDEVYTQAQFIKIL